MDPLSIAASASALASFAFKASKAIYTSIEAVKSADSALLQLQTEVEALGSGLSTIDITFKSREVVDLCTSESKYSRLLTSVIPLLDDCEKTLKVLGSLLEGIKGKPGKLRELLRKPTIVIKLSFKAEDVQNIRHQIRSYSSAMQMTFHMVEICLSLDGNKQVEFLGDKLSQQLSSLAAQIADVQQKVSETKESTLDGENQALDAEQNQNIKEYIRTAEVIFSNASVYAESVSGTVFGDPVDFGNLTGIFGSVLGMDDYQRQRVDQWLPGDKITEDDDEDDDVADIEFFRARLILAQKKLKENEYKGAEAQFEACLADVVVIGTLPPHEVHDLKLELATVYRRLGNTTKQMEILHDLLNVESSELQMINLKHALGVAYLDDYLRQGPDCSNVQLQVGRKYADEARKRRRKLLGSRHESYHETLCLLVAICEAQKDYNSAEVYQSFLPPGYQMNTEWSLISIPLQHGQHAPILQLQEKSFQQNPPPPGPYNSGIMGQISIPLVMPPRPPQGHNSYRSIGSSGPPQLNALPFEKYHFPPPPTPPDTNNQYLPPLKPVFGLNLEQLFVRDGSPVPLVVYQCIQAVDTYGLDQKGIYRLSGTASHITKLKAMFNNDASTVDFRNPQNFYHDVNSVASLLKQFFRDLPDPLLTQKYWQRFVDVAKIDDGIVRRDSLHAIINVLPDPNYATLRAITLHLHRVSQLSGTNHMTPSNLSIVFGPMLMSANTIPNIADAGWQVRVIETIIQDAHHIFDDD